MAATNLHFQVRVISRGAGRSAPAAASYRSGSVVQRSAVASASYRSGETLHDARLGRTFDYTRKEDVLHAEIVAPAHAPAWVYDRSRLWNGVEAAEKRKDARLARDIIAALPRGLDAAAYQALAREFINDNFVAHGMIADFAIHDKDASDGGRNPHMHIMLTTRAIEPEGFGQKNRDWNRRELVGEWRDAFEQLCNRYLEEAGSAAQVSLQSYAERGIDRQPGEHLGPEGWGLEQKGQETTRGNRNRRAANDNQRRAVARAYAETLEPPPAADPVPAPPAARHLKEASHALTEGWSGDSDLRQTSHQLWAQPDPAGAVSDAPELRVVSQRLTAANDNEQARRAAGQRALLTAAMQQTWRMGAAFREQVKHYAGLLKEQVAALGRDETSGAFDRLRHLRDVASEQTRQREPDHER